MIAVMTTLLALVILAAGVCGGFVWGVSYAVSREREKIAEAARQEKYYLENIGKKPDPLKPPRNPLA